MASMTIFYHFRVLRFSRIINKRYNLLAVPKIPRCNYGRVYFTSYETSSELLRKNSVYCLKRFKYKKPAKDEESDSEGEDSDTEDGSKLVTGHVSSLRADAVLKAGLGMARNKIETSFYESKLLLNGKKLMKKSQKVSVGDELDLIKDTNKMNENLIDVSRVVVVSAEEAEDGDKLRIRMKRFKTLTIENPDA